MSLGPNLNQHFPMEISVEKCLSLWPMFGWQVKLGERDGLILLYILQVGRCLFGNCSITFPSGNQVLREEKDWIFFIVYSLNSCKNV